MKKLIAAALAATIALALAGCGGDEKTEAPTIQQQDPEPEQAPMPEAEPANANAELADKLEVTFELHPTEEEGKHKLVVTVRNVTNTILEDAGLYVMIDSEREGRVFREYYPITNLEPWRAVNAVEFIEAPDDAVASFLWHPEYTFSEEEPAPDPDHGVENPELAKAFCADIRAADYVDWRDYLVDAKVVEYGETMVLTVILDRGVDPVAAAKPMGHESIANAAGWNGFGGVFPTRVVLQYDDGTIIIEKDM